MPFRSTTSTAHPVHDVQAWARDVRSGLSPAGVTGVDKATRIRRGDSENLVGARIDCAVDLDPRAEVRHAARYPLERTPVTGLAAASERGVRRVVGVEVKGVDACPSAQRMGRRRSAERLLEAGFGALDVERILELVRVATHDQRGRRTLYVGTAGRIDAETLVRIVESSLSSPVYELLKRPHEPFVVEHAPLQPRFVEDSVRLALEGMLETCAGLGGADFVLSRQVNFETIHNHEVVAERYGTVGELRGDLADARRPRTPRRRSDPPRSGGQRSGMPYPVTQPLTTSQSRLFRNASM